MGGWNLRMTWGQEVCYTSLYSEPASALNFGSSAEIKTLRQTLDRFSAVSVGWSQCTGAAWRAREDWRRFFSLGKIELWSKSYVVHKYVLHSCLKKNLRHPGRFLLQCALRFRSPPPLPSCLQNSVKLIIEFSKLEKYLIYFDLMRFFSRDRE